MLRDLIHNGELVQVELEDILQFGLKQNPDIIKVCKIKEDFNIIYTKTSKCPTSSFAEPW